MSEGAREAPYPERVAAGGPGEPDAAAAVSWLSLPLVLWAMLWLSINTGPGHIAAFGSGLGATITAMRAAFPLIVLAIALPSGFLGRRTRRSWVEKGLWIYATVMLLACTGAPDWFSRAYWAFAFLATLAVVDKGLQSADPLRFALRLNWYSWLITVAALVTMLFLARDVLLDPESGSGYGLITRFEATYGYSISRETGLARMAAVPAIISLVYLFSGGLLRRAACLGVFSLSLAVIWIMQARGAMIAFSGALLFVLLLRRGGLWTVGLVLGSAAILLIVANGTLDAVLSELWWHVTRGQGTDGLSTMSGRDEIWDNGIARWLRAPWFGYGPQADRLFWDVNNAQNAILYALLCAGVVGAAFFIISFASAWRALVSAVWSLNERPDAQRRMVQIAGGILVFSTLRSIPENNAALFSVDLLLQYPAMIYLVLLSARRLHPNPRVRGQL